MASSKKLSVMLAAGKGPPTGAHLSSVHLRKAVHVAQQLDVSALSPSGPTCRVFEPPPPFRALLFPQQGPAPWWWPAP